MPLSSTFIFKPAINYGDERVTQRSTTTVIHAMTDNDYTTFSSVDDVDIDVSSGGNATRIDCIALKTKNVDSYSFTPTGGTGTGFANRAIPTEYTTADGRAQTSIVNGFQHEIYLLPSQITATGVQAAVQRDEHRSLCGHAFGIGYGNTRWRICKHCAAEGGSRRDYP